MMAEPIDPIYDGGGGGGVYTGGATSSYAGAGGAVGGLSPAGANYSALTGVGAASGYNSFTPSSYDLASSFSGYYKGLGGINQGGSSLISTLNQIFNQYKQGNISLTQALSQATQLQSDLSNSGFFYQAKHGKDAAALQNFKYQAGSIVNQISAYTAPLDTTNNNPAGTTTTQAPTLLDTVKSLLSGAAPSTNFEAPPNLYQFTPEQQSSSSGGIMNLKTVAILAVLGYVAYWLYKKYA